MAGFGTTFGQDYTMKGSAATLTTTSQWLVCTPATVTGNADFTVDITNTITAHHRLVGVLQSYPSAGSSTVLVRMTGISRAICSDSVECMQWVKIDSTGTIKQVTEGTAATFTTANVTLVGILGMALENGQTSQTILVDLRPQISTYNLT